MDPTPPNGSQQNSTELVTYHTSAPTASWVFGGLILVFLMIVVFVPIEPSKFPIIRYLMALAAAFFAIFFVGGVLLRGTVNGLFISATGGFVLFVLIAFVFDPFKVLPSASSPLSSTNPLVTSSPERSDLVKPSVTPAVSPEIAKSTPQPSVVSTPTPPINIIGTVEAVSGDQQIIPLSDWRTFAVRVVDNQRQPIVGAKVAWRTLECGTQVYVGETDTFGISSATNMCTSTTGGSFTQTAMLVDRNTKPGFTQLDKVTPIGNAVRFNYKQQ